MWCEWAAAKVPPAANGRHNATLGQVWGEKKRETLIHAASGWQWIKCECYADLADPGSNSVLPLQLYNTVLRLV